VSSAPAATVAQVLSAAGCRVNPGRALVRAGLKRRQADRLLATPTVQDRDQAQLSRLRVLLDAQAQGDPHAGAEEIRSLARDLLTEPAQVQVRIVGPDWLDPTLWLPADSRLGPKQARRVHHLLDGRMVAGHRLRVVLEPPLRIGRRPSPRRARAERRRSLFSMWDQGVRWDDEGLFSATPEALALAMVAGAQGIAVDAGCGLGSLALALARTPGVTRVVAIERDPDRLGLARHNAAVYGVADRIQFVHGDAVDVLARTPCDVLVADPPWGGRDYDRTGVAVADLGLDLGALLAHAPADTRLKLPPSILPETLPGRWLWRPAVDHEGRLKFLVASRA